MQNFNTKELLKECNMSDQELINSVLNGYNRSFEYLMRRYNQRLFRVVISYVKSEEVTRDILQETYLKCFKNLSRFKGGSSFATWLTRIGINESLQYLRKSSYRASPEITFQHTSSPQPDSQYQTKELRKLLEHAIDELAPNYRVVFVMYELEGLSCNEIAQCLSLSLSTVKVRLHRARARLKHLLLSVADYHTLYEFGNENCDQLVAKVFSKLNSMVSINSTL